jgi:hypothetical protein
MTIFVCVISQLILQGKSNDLYLADKSSGPSPPTGGRSASESKPTASSESRIVIDQHGFSHRTTPPEAESSADSESLEGNYDIVERSLENLGDAGNMLISFKNLQKRLCKRGAVLNRSETCVELPSTTAISKIREVLVSKGEPKAQIIYFNSRLTTHCLRFPRCRYFQICRVISMHRSYMGGRVNSAGSHNFRIVIFQAKQRHEDQRKRDSRIVLCANQPIPCPNQSRFWTET